jgi:hypothetical protein
MSEHVLMLAIGGVFGILHLVGLVLLGLQLREARRDAERLAQTMGRMALGMDALARKL